MYKKIFVFIVAFCIMLYTSVTYVKAEVIPSVSAKGYILINAITGESILEKDADAFLPMASTTKIMTALLSLEADDIYSYFTVDSNAILVEGSSAGLKSGDKVNLFTLSVGMLLESGNDAANAAAVKIGGSIEKFAELMNKKAKEIGMESTNFVTPSGLNHDNHYTTARDMAILARYALSNEMFSYICSQSSMTVEYGNPPYKRTLRNHNRLLKDYEGCIGVKTGFTKVAGRCLVSAAERNGVKLICVTLSAADDWNAHKSMFDYGFKKILPIELQDKTEYQLNAVGGNRDLFKATAKNTVSVGIDEKNKNNIVKKVIVSSFYYSPIKEGNYIGKVEYYYDNVKFATIALQAEENVDTISIVKEKSIFEKIYDFFF